MDIRNKIKNKLYKMSLGFTPLRMSLTINITNRCDRHCDFCPYHSSQIANNYHTKWFKAQPDYLSCMDFKEFIKSLGIFRKMIRHISITGKGEPTLHPMFISFCDICEYNKIPFSITSNGRDIDLVKRLSNYKYLTNIRISIYDLKTWRKWKLIKLPKLCFYNMTPKDIDGIEYGFISAQYGIQHKRAIKDFNKKTFCKTSFHFITMNTDGGIVPCYSYHEIGTLRDGFLKLWNGREIRAFRHQAVNGRNIKLADCDSCGVNYGKD